MNLSRLEKEIAGIVIKINESPDLIHYPYHNLDHTQSVVSHAKEIAAFYLLNEKDVFIVTVAAWFHDIGHLYGVMQGHEERGVLIMEQYLKGVPKELITSVSECIMATKFPSNPRTLREEIICDADTYHFGTSVFRQTDVLVHKEVEIRTGKKIPDWAEQALQLLKTHTFYTGYCQRLLNEGKRQNISWLESLIHSA
ncbi:MAG TPA: HD domain-containing protein [Puia sp.]